MARDSQMARDLQCLGDLGHNDQHANVCTVTGCGAPLSMDKTYCARKHICSAHMRAEAVSLGNGSPLQRFCFQCGKLEPLTCFDGLKRTCRQRLLKRRACPGKRRCHRITSRHPVAQLAGPAVLQPASPIHALPASSACCPAFSAPLPQPLLSGPLSCSGSDSNSGTAMGYKLPQLPYAAAGMSCTLPMTSSYSDSTACGWAQLLPGFDARTPRRDTAGPPAPRRLSSTLDAPPLIAAASSPLPPAAAPTAAMSAPLPSCSGCLQPHTPAADLQSELELVLASELTAAGLQAALSSCTEARLGSDASRELSWQLAAAVVENSLSLADSAASDLRLLQTGAMAAGGCGAATLPCTKLEPSCSFSAWGGDATAAPQQQQRQHLATCGLLLGGDTSTSSATSGGSQVPAADRTDRLEHLRQHVAVLQARMESLRAQIAMS